LHNRNRRSPTEGIATESICIIATEETQQKVSQQKVFATRKTTEGIATEVIRIAATEEKEQTVWQQKVLQQNASQQY
jgi:hypothetical protein